MILKEEIKDAKMSSPNTLDTFISFVFSLWIIEFKKYM